MKTAPDTDEGTASLARRSSRGKRIGVSKSAVPKAGDAPKGKPRILEGDVMRLVRDYLGLRGWFVMRHQQGLGSIRGFPDLTALKDGLTIYVECKTPGGNLTADQWKFRRSCEDYGGRYLVARGIEDLEGL